MSTVKVNAAQIGQSITTTNNFTMYQPASPDGTVRLGNGNAGSVTDLVVLNSSGNLGLGVTPSAWATSRKVLQVGGSAALWSNASGAGFAFFSNNAYNDGAWKYINTSAASYYTQTTDSSHVWYQAPSGTAGNPITFTQAMTLDASGNLLVGGTSTPFGSAGRGLISINGSGQAVLGMTVGGVDKAYLFADGTNTTLSNSAAGALIFATNAGSERMRIDSSGNVGIGTSSPSAFGKFVVSGGVSVFANSNVDGTLSDCAAFQSPSYGTTYQNIIRSSVSLDYRNSIYAFNICNGSGGSTTESMRIQGYRLMLKGSTVDANDGSTGIAFPATQNASSNANTLDDYEEGTWTPTCTNGTANSASYTKIGRMVYIYGDITFTISSGTTGAITGLPFTGTAPQTAVSIAWQNIAGAPLSGVIVYSIPRIDVYDMKTGGVSFGNGARIIFNAAYQAS